MLKVGDIVVREGCEGEAYEIIHFCIDGTINIRSLNYGYYTIVEPEELTVIIEVED